MSFLSNSQVTVIGLGYVGLTTALSFARVGLSVNGFEISKDKARAISEGKVPFSEPGISKLLQDCLSAGTFKVSDSFVPSEINFIAVGTPGKQDGSSDLSFIQSASKMLGIELANFPHYSVIVVKSTVTPGTTENIVKRIIEEESRKETGKELGLAMNPEFLREGSALRDIMEPDRLVIGQFDEKSGSAIEGLYFKVYPDRNFPILRTNLVNAELIKYASNAFLATKISYANLIANIASTVPGADVTTIVKGMGYDKRIGESFLGAGVGYGGSCFPKDTRALTSFSRSRKVEPLLLQSTEDLNNNQALKVVEMASEELGSIKGKKFAVLGLSFKPNTDDIREAPSLKIIRALLDQGAGRIIAYDPEAANNVRGVFGERIIFAKDCLEAITGADCAILVTEWEEFRHLTPDQFVSRMITPVLIDGRRIYDPRIFSKSLKFRAIGLGPEKK
jgi:UDPglucose 6-dehydrogenase